MAELDKQSREIGVPGDWTYASAPESREIVHIRDRYGYYVGGEWLEPAESYETIAPRDEEVLASVGQATAADVDGAVNAAREAYSDGWSSLPGSERAKYLFRIARILQERSREFAVLESLNGGKPIKESRDV
ncbi:MAG: aldehyde dehydrogenase family protein, partial [Gaiellaceae bacterium]